MRQDLEKVYIPSCTDCLHNKSATRKPTGPLHSLPIPDDRGDSVAIDFIEPLPHNDEFDCILSMTDHLGSDEQIVPRGTSGRKVVHIWDVARGRIVGVIRMMERFAIVPSNSVILFPFRTKSFITASDFVKAFIKIHNLVQFL